MATINYIELPARAYAESKAFYASAFGVALTDFGPRYSCTTTGVTDIGLQGDTTRLTSAPLPVILVDDLEAAAVSVINAGGVITHPIFSFPGGRRFHFCDPSGNELAVWTQTAE